MHWADNGFEELRRAGFELTLDAALDGWIAHAEALNVRLLPADGSGEKSDAGSESAGDATSPWFDLSLGLEINGQRHNILPLLPGLIAAAAALPADPVTGLPQLPSFV